MSNYLKENGYSHSQVKVVPMYQVVNPCVDKTLEELTSRIDELNLLTIVLKGRNVATWLDDIYQFTFQEYTCVDNHDLLALRILQGVKNIHAVVLEQAK